MTLPTFTLADVAARPSKRDEILAAYRNDGLALISAVEAAMSEVEHDEDGAIPATICCAGCELLGAANLLALHTLCTLNEIDPDEGLISGAATYLAHALQHGSHTAMMLGLVGNTATECAKSLYEALDGLDAVYATLREIESEAATEEIGTRCEHCGAVIATDTEPCGRCGHVAGQSEDTNSEG